MKPFLSYIGSKQKFMKKLKPLFPKNINNYYAFITNYLDMDNFKIYFDSHKIDIIKDAKYTDNNSSLKK